jgi:hypothetical protein
MSDFGCRMGHPEAILSFPLYSSSQTGSPMASADLTKHLPGQRVQRHSNKSAHAQTIYFLIVHLAHKNRSLVKRFPCHQPVNEVTTETTAAILIYLNDHFVTYILL